MREVPQSLRIWFVIHYLVDMVFAIPLIFFTAKLLTSLSFGTENLILARLVGAALIGIWGTSFIMYKKSIEAYRTMLTLKLVWSGSAILAITISLLEAQLGILWLSLLIFIVFFSIWAYYLFKLKGIK